MRWNLCFERNNVLVSNLYINKPEACTRARFLVVVVDKLKAYTFLCYLFLLFIALIIPSSFCSVLFYCIHYYSHENVNGSYSYYNNHMYRNINMECPLRILAYQMQLMCVRAFKISLEICFIFIFQNSYVYNWNKIYLMKLSNITKLLCQFMCTSTLWVRGGGGFDARIV